MKLVPTLEMMARLKGAPGMSMPTISKFVEVIKALGAIEEQTRGIKVVGEILKTQKRQRQNVVVGARKGQRPRGSRKDPTMNSSLEVEVGPKSKRLRPEHHVMFLKKSYNEINSPFMDPFLGF